MAELKSIIKSIQDIMRKDVGIDGDAQRIGQLVWMLFLKILDARETQLESLENNSPIPEHLRWRNWACNREGMTEDRLSDFIRCELFPTLKALRGDHTNQAYSEQAFVIRSVFADAHNYMKSDRLIRQVVNKINEINFIRSGDRHIFGDIYEQILRDLQSAGNAGEFYTPRAVTQFMVDMINPQLGEIIMDPACGTGGFLSSAIEHLRHRTKTARDWEVLQHTIHGVEKKSLPHLLCTTNMLLHGICILANIKRGNMLALSHHTGHKKPDIVLTNPPFGGKEEEGIEHHFPDKFRTRETADLFLYLVVEMLKSKGRAAIVLPDGTLSGQGVKTRLKEKILKECNLHTIIRLPQGVFSPYTEIQTNLIFLEKGQSTKEIWYYEHPLPKNHKKYTKTKPLQIEEFEKEKAWWTDRQETEQAWRVSIATIKERGFNLDIENPHTTDNNFGDVEVLRKKYRAYGTTKRRTSKALRENLLDSFFSLAGDASDASGGLEHFDSLTFEALLSGKNSISNLRKLILSLAMCGKLVAQHGKEKSHTRSQNHQTRNDQIRRDSYFSKTPKHWKLLPLRMIARSFNGNSIPKAKKEQVYAHVKHGHAFIATKDIDYATHAIRYDTGIKIPFGTTGFKIATRDSILICAEGGNAGKKIAITDRDIAFGNKLFANEFQSCVLPKFAFYVLQSKEFMSSFSAAMTGMIGGISLTNYRKLLFPLPSFAEQRDIVSKMDELMLLCDTLDSAISEQERLSEALMQAVSHELIVTEHARRNVNG